MFPGEDESDWMDEDELDDDVMVGAVSEAPPMQSIEEEFLHGASLPTPEYLISTPSPEAEMELALPAPSPRTQARLDRFEQSYVAALKEEQNKAGKQISILDLAGKSFGHKSSPNSTLGNENQSQLEGNTVRTPKPQPLTMCCNNMEDRPENHSPDSCVENLALVRTPCNEANIQRGVGPNASALQRLKPGTYCAGEPVLLGWHTEQLPRVGVNDTAEHDFRQSVFATISSSGQLNIRLRSHNMQGVSVPHEFRLKGTISVSHKDVIYHPIFHGMSYDEIRFEVARQSLVPAQQRAGPGWVPTPVIQGNSGRSIQPECLSNKLGIRPLIDVEIPPTAAGSARQADESAVEGSKVAASSLQGCRLQASDSGCKERSREDAETTSWVTVGTEKRGTSHSEFRGRHSEGTSFTGVNRQTNLLSKKPNEGNSGRIGTPEPPRKLLADEARKQQKPLTRQRIPCHNSPPRRPGAHIRRSNRNRITPSRFYGIQSSKRNIGIKDQRPFQERTSEIQTQSCPQELTIPPQPRPNAQQTAESFSIDNSVISSTLLEQDDSDNESFPEVEELHRRLVKAAEHNDAPASQRNPQGDQDLRRTSTGVVHKESRVQGTHSQKIDHDSPRTDILICHAEYVPASLGRTGADPKQLMDGGPQRRGQKDGASTPSSSHSIKRSRKRSRCHSVGNSRSNFADSSDVSSLKPATVSESLDLVPSIERSHPSKRQKQSPQFGSSLNTKSASGLEGRNRRNTITSPTRTPTAPGNHVSREELEAISDSPVGGRKGKATQYRAQDKHRVPNPGPVTEKGHSSNRKGHGNKKFTFHRSSYERPDGPSASAIPWKQGRTGQRKRGRRQEFGRHNQTSSANDRNKKGKGKDKRNRFLREKTTDTIDFEKFSPEGKLDYVCRELWRVKEVLRNVRKED
ncbi:hypothetical protein F5Y06DRAFT_255883 [Hypoxylon sp. FL0890]|nr:hypothetical protein F5Y06DRAFT_255883 [Hypoxylon sp. FL0890]